MYANNEEFLKSHNIKYLMTVTCKLHTNININKVLKYMNSDIIQITENSRFKNSVYATLILPNSTNIKFKIFINGVLQFMDCHYDNFITAVNILIQLLRTGANGTNKHIEFIDNHNTIGIYDIKTLQVNSHFDMGYTVNIDELLKLLDTHHSSTTLDTDIGYVKRINITYGHRCSIEYQKITIHVFDETIAIWGKSIEDIIIAYEYINKILYRYENNIKIVSMDTNDKD